MKESTLYGLEKLDIIEITNEEYGKIWSWVSSNWNELKEKINEIKLPFNEFVIRGITDSIYLTNELKYFNFGEYFKIITFLEDKCTKKIEPMVIWNYKKYNNFEILRDAFFKYERTDYYVEVTKEFVELWNDEYDEENIKDNIINLTDEDRIESLKMLFRVLIYSQFNQDKVIKQSKTHSHKIQSKKDKRAGKKPKIKLTKQTIIRLNTDHLPTLTEEEKREYERHTFGWTVRGHWRTYQSGKKVWIKPQIRGDKDNVQGKVYEV